MAAHTIHGNDMSIQSPRPSVNFNPAVEKCEPFDTAATRTTEGTTGHLTKPANNAGKVIGNQGDRSLTKMAPTPFVLITNHLATVFWLLSGMASCFTSSSTRGGRVVDVPDSTTRRVAACCGVG